MGSKGGGGGGGSQAQLNVPAGLSGALSNEAGLGSYTSNLFDSLSSLINWAGGAATAGTGAGGGGSFQNIPSFASSAVQPGPPIQGGKWTDQFDPGTGLVTFTSEKSPQDQFTESIAGPGSNAQGIPLSTTAQWQGDYAQNLLNQLGNQGFGGLTYSGVDTSQNLLLFNDAKTGQQVAYRQDTGQWGTFVDGKFGPQNSMDFHAMLSPEASSTANQLGPYLGAAWQQIQSISGIENQTANLGGEFAQEGQNLFQTGTSQLASAENFLGQQQAALTGTEAYIPGYENTLTATEQGTLFPGQQAAINQAVRAQQAAVQQQLENEGLGSSTAAGVLKGQAAQEGAATAGGLMQGNITAAAGALQAGTGAVNAATAAASEALGGVSAAQATIALGQASQKLALGAQDLSTMEAQTMASLAAGLQGQLYSEATGGLQILNSMIDTASKAYGIDVQGYSNILNADTQIGEARANAAQAEAQASNSSMGALGQGLGAILGGGQGGSGGLLGALGSGLGSIFGAGGAGAGVAGTAVAAGEAGVTAAGTSGLGAIIPAIIGLISAF